MSDEAVPFFAFVQKNSQIVVHIGVVWIDGNVSHVALLGLVVRRSLPPARSP